MTRLGVEQRARIAKALADDRRFGILEAIARTEELSCRELVERLPIAQATVSHHLKELANAGLIAVRQEGQCRFYQLRTDTVAEYLRQVERRLLGRRVPA
ncbi:MAG: helix-turn-helix transcriptional regulator [Gemmatimonadetes bacterium]|nr:helix-turn-helix transcriptional regulator [Gemmatimonadota bacterium]